MFARDGYKVEQWSDVTDLAALEKGTYDIVFLDIKGVGKQIADDEGLGVLRRLRRASPIQIIVAFSNQQFSLEDKPFFDLATAAVDKTNTDYVDYKSLIDDLLEKRFSLNWYVDQVIDIVHQQTRDAKKLRKQTEKAILHRSTHSFEKRMNPQTAAEEETVEKSLLVIRSAISVLERCHGS